VKIHTNYQTEPAGNLWITKAKAMNYLGELILAASDLLRPGMHGIICPGLTLQEVANVPDIPGINVSQIDAGVSIDFEPTAPGTDTVIGSTIANMTYPTIDLYKLIHDFTFYIFGPVVWMMIVTSSLLIFYLSEMTSF